MKYHGPADRLRAAKATGTPPEELSLLSQSEFTFVRVAVAANPSTPQSTLHSLIPPRLQSQEEFEIAVGLIMNPMLQAEDCERIGSLIRESIDRISLRDFYPAQLINAFVRNANVPVESLIALADPASIPKHIRHYIAVPGVRPELLNKLLEDPSPKVKSRAARALYGDRVEPITFDVRIEIWNILHDGQITAISGEQGPNLTMFVSIPYLRRRLDPLGDSFVLTLGGLNRLEWHNSDGTITPFREELELGTPEILNTESESMPVTIETTMGNLVLDFESIRFRLDTGKPVTYQEIRKVCEDYWTEWKRKYEQARGDEHE